YKYYDQYSYKLNKAKLISLSDSQQLMKKVDWICDLKQIANIFQVQATENYSSISFFLQNSLVETATDSKSHITALRTTKLLLLLIK
ncbi:hypothetical protein, partial [Photobacterium indicum]|uniref:hypothetical protein n=1 Tax=Photobacterium indicum TaxID=81447 RepID=UPI003D1206EF